MIALGLLLLAGAYLWLFVITGRRSRSWPQRALWWLVLLAPLIALTWDMPVGYQRFKALCASEGGLQVYQPDPPPAKVLRMSADHWDEATARSVLASYPALDAVEALDVNFGTARPPAYARYERNPMSPVPTTGPRDNFKPIVTSLDKIERRPTGTVTLAAGSSKADYVLTEVREDRSIRLSIARQWLRKPDGTPIASMTSATFAWTNTYNTILGRTATETCFAIRAHTYDDQLVTLITKTN